MQLGELFMSRPLQWIYLGRWHRRGWRPAGEPVDSKRIHAAGVWRWNHSPDALCFQIEGIM